MALDPQVMDQLVEAVRRFVEERLIPREREVAEADLVPDELIAEMKVLGLFGLSIPEEYGGLGLDLAEEVRVVQELGRTSPAFRSVFGTNVGIGSQGILIDGTDEQKRAYLPRLASGELIGSFALTEPEAGSDAASVRTRAEKDGNAHYRITGIKRFITNAPRAGVFTLMARTGSQEDGARGITAFLVDADLPGITLGKPDRKMGQQGAHTCDVNLDDVRVSAEAIIGGKVGQGFKTAMKVLDRGRLHLSAVAVGAARRLIDESLSYAMDRKQFGQRIADFQLIQAMLADSETEWLAGKSLIEAAARDYDVGVDVARRAACAKLFCTEMVGRVADRAVQIHGGAGYVADFPVERFYRDVRLFRLYEGTSQIQQLVIARSMIREAERNG